MDYSDYYIYPAQQDLEIKDCIILFTVSKNCADIYKSGDKISGVYKIDPDGLGEFEVFCDHKTAGGGWTIGSLR